LSSKIKCMGTSNEI